MAIEYLNKIPNELWVVISGFGGGILTLLVTYIQNRFEKERLGVQLSHDKEVRREDREMSMRREIYYDAIDSLAVSINFLSTLADADLQNPKINMSDLSSKFQKIQLIAGNDVLDFFNQCSNLIGQSFVNLLPLKIQLQKLESDKELATKLHDMAAEQVKNIICKMEELNKEKVCDENRWKPLNDAAAKYNADVQKFIKDGVEIGKVIFSKRMELLKQSIQWLKPINTVAGKLLIAMRKELDESLEKETLEFLDKVISDTNSKNSELFEKLLRDMEGLVKDLAKQ